MTAPTGPDSDPRQQRFHRLIRGELSSANGPTREIMVRNISASGLGGTSKGAPVARGEQVMIALPRIGAIAGTVCWSKGATFGVKLAGALDLEVLADALRSKQGASSEGNVWEVKRIHRI